MGHGMTKQQLRKIVFSNLDDAKENGAFEVGGYLDSATALEIAEDMAALAADCEDKEPKELEPFVREWLEQYRGKP
jgi:hypothetical protein